MDKDDCILEFVGSDQAGLVHMGDCRPEDVGLSAVSSSSGSIHLEYRPGDRVLSTFSGSDSTLLFGNECSSLHMLAAKCDCISDFSRVLSISV